MQAEPSGISQSERTTVSCEHAPPHTRTIQGHHTPRGSGGERVFSRRKRDEARGGFRNAPDHSRSCVLGEGREKQDATSGDRPTPLSTNNVSWRWPQG